MMNESHRALLRSQGVLVGRILLGLLFFFSGIGMLMGGVSNTAGYFASLGIPLAGIAAYLVVILKLGAGGALIVGYRTGLAAAALLVFTALATLIAHMDINDTGLFKNLAIIGGLLYAMAYGPGEGWSLQGSAPKVETTPTEPTPTL